MACRPCAPPPARKQSLLAGKGQNLREPAREAFYPSGEPRAPATAGGAQSLAPAVAAKGLAAFATRPPGNDHRAFIVISNWRSRFKLPDLGRYSRGFSGNGLGTFPSDFLHPGRADSTPVPTRLRRVAHSNGFAVRPGIRTVVCLAAIACRQRATRRSRVGTLPQADTAGGSRSKSAISISAEVRKSEIRIWTQPSRQSITWEDSCPIAMFHRCSLRRALTRCGCC